MLFNPKISIFLIQLKILIFSNHLEVLIFLVELRILIFMILITILIERFAFGPRISLMKTRILIFIINFTIFFPQLYYLWIIMPGMCRKLRNQYWVGDSEILVLRFEINIVFVECFEECANSELKLRTHRNIIRYIFNLSWNINILYTHNNINMLI